MSLRRTSSSARGGTLVDLGTAWSETKTHQSFEYVLNNILNWVDAKRYRD